MSARGVFRHVRRISALTLLCASSACSDASGDDDGDRGIQPGLAMGNEHRPSGVAHCYTAFSNRHAATRDFWVVFRSGDLQSRARAVAGLARAAAAHPQEEEFALLNGLANLWRVAEPLPAEEDDNESFVVAALTARSELERAYALCPTDHRIAAWLGPILVNMGKATGDANSIEQGLAVIRKGMDHYPGFVSFSKLLVFADRPREHTEYQDALATVRANIATCSPRDPACSNHAHAAHNAEGAAVFYGDALAKGGDRQAALDAYGIAHRARSYDEWNYQALLRDRIATLDARISAFGTSDTADDPQSAWQSTVQCSICHVQ